MLACERRGARAVTRGSAGAAHTGTMKQLALIAAALTAATATPAIAQPSTVQPVIAQPAIGQEARIAFPNNATIRTFRADGRETVYIQDRARRWYRASVIGPCNNLPWAQAIGVERRGVGTLDRFSTLIVEGDRCQLNSFVRVSGPPERRPRN